MDNIFRRVSVRDFTEHKVEEEKIALLLKAAMAAPSANNQQPWEFIVTTDAAMIKEISQATPWSRCAAKAPLVIVLCKRTEGLTAPEFAPQDLGICAENILLAAVDIGLGGVYIGVAPDNELMASATKIIKPPVGLEVFCILAVGYPAKIKCQKDRFDPARVHRV